MLTDLSLGLQFPKNVLKKTDDFNIEPIELDYTSHPEDPSATHASSSAILLRSSDATANIIPTIEEVSEDSHLIDADGDMEFPEGGTKAYLVTFGSFMGLIPGFGLINSIGAIEAYISSHQLSNVSSSTVAWIFSIYIFVTFASSIFSGALFDRNGPKGPMIIGTLLFSGGLFATANSSSVYQFILSFGVTVGLGNGLVMSPLVGVVSHYFKKKRATATSIATTGGSIGGIVFPMMLRKLYAEVGYQWAMRVLAFVCLFCLTLSIFLVKERLKKEATEEKPSFQKLLKIYFQDLFDLKYFAETKFISFAFAIALVEGSLVVSSVYFTSYAIKRGFSENTSYLLVTVLNIVGVLGRYIPGYLADRFVGRFNVAIITVAACVLMNLVVWLPFGYNLGVLYAYSVLYGFFSGSILSLSPVCCGQISRTEDFGKRYSTAYLVVSLAMLALIPIGGAIVGDQEIRDYNNLIIYSSMLAVAGIVCYIISRTACVGFKLCKF